MLGIIPCRSRTATYSALASLATIGLTAKRVGSVIERLKHGIREQILGTPSRSRDDEEAESKAKSLTNSYQLSDSKPAVDGLFGLRGRLNSPFFPLGRSQFSKFPTTFCELYGNQAYLVPLFAQPSPQKMRAHSRLHPNERRGQIGCVDQ